MKNVVLSAILGCLSAMAFGQNDSMWTQYQLINNIDQAAVGSVKISGYGEMHYNQPLDGAMYQNGKLDVHRMVMLFGYKFNPRTSFVTEIEFEHVKEVAIEQLFVKYKLKSNMHFKAGLVLIPMGIINEYHEPTTFFSTERPTMDNKVIPTTWREIGAGITGTIPTATLRYQIYVVNGLAGYNDGATLGGSSGLRGGRQKGAETIVSSPNFSGKVNYYGLRNLNIGLAGYIGETQSNMFNGLDRSDDIAVESADSSVVGMQMLGLDARYKRKGLELRGQAIFTQISNSGAYNQLTMSDLGSKMFGYYIEAGYNVLANTNRPTQLIPFVRFEHYDVHLETDGDLDRNESYRADELIAGLNYRVSDGVVFKSDVQMVRRGNMNTFNSILNMGVGIWF